MILTMKEISLITGLLMQSGDAIDPEQTICMARNIYHEARSESVEGQLYVAHVTLNRVVSSKFPNDTCSVVTDDRGPKPWDCQFSWWCDGKSDTPSENEWSEYQLATLLAIEVLSGRSEDPTDGALYYVTETAYDNHDWPKRLDVVKQIGSHIFLKEG